MTNKADKTVREFRHRMNEIADGETEPGISGADLFIEALVEATEKLVDDPEYQFKSVRSTKAAK